MTTPILTAAPTPLFIPLRDFKLYGLPGRTRSYDLAKLGLLDLRKDPAGRVGVTVEGARAYLAGSRPIAECKRPMAANEKRVARRAGVR